MITIILVYLKRKIKVHQKPKNKTFPMVYSDSNTANKNSYKSLRFKEDDDDDEDDDD